MLPVCICASSIFIMHIILMYLNVASILRQINHIIYLCLSKQECRIKFVINVTDWQIKSRLRSINMIMFDLSVNGLKRLWWYSLLRLGTLNSSVNQKANPVSPSDWLWPCVTNRGRMYATLGPNWRVPLRNSPRSRSYVYRYSEVGERVALNEDELIFLGKSGVTLMCFISPHPLTACWWKLGAISDAFRKEMATKWPKMQIILMKTVDSLFCLLSRTTGTPILEMRCWFKQR